MRQRAFDVLARHRGARIAVWCLAAAVVVLRTRWSEVHDGVLPDDTVQLVPSLEHLARLQLASVYPPGGDMTSPPGILVVVAPFVRLFGTIPDLAYFTVVGTVSVLWLGWCAGRLLRFVCPELPTASAALACLLLAASAPVLDGTVGAFHPEDLLCSGLVLLCVEAACRRRHTPLGLLLGAALLTRQWAVLAVPVLLLVPGIERRRVLLVTSATWVAVAAPFAVANPAGFATALRASSTSVSSFSLWFHFPGGVSHHAYLIARDGPLLALLPATIWLSRRWRSGEVTAVHVTAAVGVFLALRQPFDTFDAPYYLLPAWCAFVVVCVATRSRIMVELGFLVDLVLTDPRAVDRVQLTLVGCLLVEGLMVAWGMVLARAAFPRSRLPSAAVAPLVPMTRLRRAGPYHDDGPRPAITPVGQGASNVHR